MCSPIHSLGHANRQVVCVRTACSSFALSPGVSLPFSLFHSLAHVIASTQSFHAGCLASRDLDVFQVSVFVEQAPVWLNTAELPVVYQLIPMRVLSLPLTLSMARQTPQS